MLHFYSAVCYKLSRIKPESQSDHSCSAFAFEALYDDEQEFYPELLTLSPDDL